MLKALNIKRNVLAFIQTKLLKRTYEMMHQMESRELDKTEEKRQQDIEEVAQAQSKRRKEELNEEIESLLESADKDRE
ncbi:MAG: hypothetical protein MHMPM18_004290 [Marteilia pararefringens]